MIFAIIALIALAIFALGGYFIITGTAAILCANWFGIVMIILALGVFYYMKNKSNGGGT